ncbi:glycosyltransferase family 2 protein [Devosia sp. WQ 349]|uniref:glycosyltransferase family 2 protein n=1 Tax=Devosia sp. WQ 349K1 TaxID=2800329 RepID=UPI001908FA72|nr:glycosyltransferase family A protein [Devosia sp. WQ 349K1]MBK1794449.1 glycosyltransferase family 2 protein [Devosia sp. WQ 349K1]
MRAVNDYPIVSVVIPTFNRGAAISRSVESAANQDWPNIEIIIVDDHSTDDTWQYIQTIKSPRVRAVRHEVNGGGGRARNTGIDEAKGDFIAFLDSDDYWSPDKISRQMEVSTSRGDKTVVYNRISMVIGARNERVPKYAWDEKIPIEEYLVIHEQSMQTSGLLLHKNFAKSVRFDDDLRKHQDIDFVLSLNLHGGKFVFCPADTVFYENSSLQNRVSTNPKPELTQILLNKWVGKITHRTVCYYKAVNIAPMQARRSLSRSFATLASTLPHSLPFAKRIIEGYIFWNLSETSYNNFRSLYRTILRKR